MLPVDRSKCLKCSHNKIQELQEPVLSKVTCLSLIMLQFAVNFEYFLPDVASVK